MTSPAEARQPLLDNAKFLAVTLVIVGHALEPLRGTSYAAWVLYLWLYTFHVPVLVFLAGMTSRAVGGGRAWLAIGRAVLVPYALFQGLYFAFDAWALSRGPLRLEQLWTPYWLLWFLFSLFTWRVLLPWVLKLPAPWLVATVAALAAGALPSLGQPWSAARTLTFFPFFVLGHQFGPAVLGRLRHAMARVLGAGALLGALFLARNVLSTMNVRWLYGSHGYEALEASLAEGVLTRAAILLGGCVFGAAFLAWVPREAGAITALGTRSLQAYLLHGFIVLGLAAFLPAPWLATPGAFVGAIGLGVLLGWALSTHFARRLTWPLWLVNK